VIDDDSEDEDCEDEDCDEVMHEGCDEPGEIHLIGLCYVKLQRIDSLIGRTAVMWYCLLNIKTVFTLEDELAVSLVYTVSGKNGPLNMSI